MKHNNKKFKATLDITDILERAVPNNLYHSSAICTNHINPLYTIVGSKNTKMQRVTSYAVDHMPLEHKEITLVDALFI